MEITVQKFSPTQIEFITTIACENFSGLKSEKYARNWISGNFQCSPRMQYFTARVDTETNGGFVGYILWVEKGGFRKESVWELEQVAVKKELQGNGIGEELIKKSLAMIQEYLYKRDSILKTVEVTTGTENKAQKLYIKAFEDLGFEIATKCVVKDLFRGDEVMLFFKPKQNRS